MATPPAPVVADLRDVEFFGSKGIAVLLEAEQRCNQHHTTLHLLANRPVTHPSRAAGHEDTFTLFPTLGDALNTTH